MEIDFSPLCKNKLSSIKARDQVLFSRVTKQLKLFQLQSDHPSLRLHKLSGKLEDTWSISISRSIRMVFCFRQKNNQRRAVFFDIGTHEEVYR